MEKLAKITKVDLQEVWPHEAYDFTKWLAENISLLGEVLQIEFGNVRIEEAAGRYFVDIVADGADGESRIIIENQLEKTDHKHLGQLVTYASVLDAKHVLWIVKDFNDEHKQAIEWLNKNISEGINFFLIQVEVIQIGDSPYAPQFNVICEPNNRSRIIKSSASGNKISDTKLLQGEYWEQLIEYARQNPNSLNFGQRAQPQNYYNLSFGTNRAGIALTINTLKKQLGCKIWIPKEKELYDIFYNKRDEIESDIGKKLKWRRRDDNPQSYVEIAIDGDVTNKDDWEKFNEWFLDISDKFAKAFGSRIP